MIYKYPKYPEKRIMLTYKNHQSLLEVFSRRKQRLYLSNKMQKSDILALKLEIHVKHIFTDIVTHFSNNIKIVTHQYMLKMH